MSRQAAEVLLMILAEIEQMDAPPHAKYCLKNFISRTCRAAGIRVIERTERVQFARRLLDDREARPIIRDRLVARFEISRASAYNAIGEALKLSNGREKYWTNGAQTSITGSPVTTHTKDKTNEPLPE